MADRQLGNSYDKIEVLEMLQVALLCTQYMPVNRPKMSEVVLMLEGDGLAEQWAADHGHKDIHISITTHAKSLLGGATIEDNTNKHYKVLKAANTMQSPLDGNGTLEDEDDDNSMDSYAMELSGPR